MRTKRLVLVLGTAAFAAAAGTLFAGGEDCRPPADARFVVHEWGTFTSMQGSDGVALEGLTREEESLPDFVYSRTKVRDCPLRDKGWKGLEVPADHVTQKMETPVIYFHSAVARRARVRVDFKGGLISQWYPVSDLLGPPETAEGAGPLDMSKIESSFLQWDVEVQPEGARPPDGAPAVADDDPWAFARDVRASWLKTLPREKPRAGPVEAERYLFYRGLGNFPLPLEVRAGDDRAWIFMNRGTSRIGSPLLLEVRGDKGRIANVDDVPAGGGVKMEFRESERWTPLAETEEKLRIFVQRDLVAAGLFEDEARAMVRTWSRSWFKSEGMRALWILPRADTDALLPLSIDPKPDALVRVLVARTEIITPEQEEADYAALLDGQSKDPVVSARGVAAMKSRGRFVEPHLRRVIAVIDARKNAPRPTDDLIRGEAAAWLGKLVAGEENQFRR